MAIRALGGTVDDPQLGALILDDNGIVTKAWGAGYFQSIITGLNALLAAASMPKLSPSPLATPMTYTKGFRLPWVGWFQHIHDSILALGGTLEPPQFQSEILNPEPRERETQK